MKRGGKNPSSACVILTSCYLHFHLENLFIPPSSLLAISCSPFCPQVFSSFAQKASDNRRISNEMPPIVPLQLSQKLLQPLGKIMCVLLRFDSQVMGVCAPSTWQRFCWLADGWPSVLALKQRSFFVSFFY